VVDDGALADQRLEELADPDVRLLVAPRRPLPRCGQVRARGVGPQEPLAVEKGVAVDRLDLLVTGRGKVRQVDELVVVGAVEIELGLVGSVRIGNGGRLRLTTTDRVAPRGLVARMGR